MATCLVLEYLGYIYPFTRGLLKPATLLCSSVIYVTIMLVVGILTTNGYSVWGLVDRGGAGERVVVCGMWCGRAVAVFVVLNAVLAAGCATASLLGGKGPLGCRCCRCRGTAGDEEGGNRRSEACKDEKVVFGQGGLGEKP